MAFFIPENSNFFPHPLLSDPDGLLAIGSHLSPENLLLAYQFGIFPWTHEEEPLLWWFTHPRFVLFPENLKIKKSLRSVINKEEFEISFDTQFEEVIEICQTINRKDQHDTWITSDLKQCFIKLHKEGVAHSVEVWKDENLVGGLYGMALGEIFFGESMFSLLPNASQVGFVHLVNYLNSKGFTLIDCQQETEHLKQFGTELISKKRFYEFLRLNIFVPQIKGHWKYSND